MMDSETIDKMKKRYDVHPLIFHRSVERAGNAGELFDILESIPADLPVVWDEDSHRWVITDDLAQASRFEIPEEEEE
jgi:hypothetical protein